MPVATDVDLSRILDTTDQPQSEVTEYAWDYRKGLVRVTEKDVSQVCSAYRSRGKV